MNENMTEKKRGRPANSKLRAVAVFNKTTLEFISFFKNPSQASRVLTGNSNSSTNIKNCANQKLSFVHDHVFEWVDDVEITADTIRKAKEQLLKRKKIKTYVVKIYKKSTYLRLPNSVISSLDLVEGTKYKITIEKNKIIITIVD